MSASARSSNIGSTNREFTSPARLASAAATFRPLGSFSALRVSRRGSGLAASLLAACILVATSHHAVAQPAARESTGAAPEVTKPAVDLASRKVPPTPWKWQLGVGIPLLAIGVVMTGIGSAFVVNPPVTDPTGCNVLGFAGPCLLARSSSGALLGFGLAFGVGGAVLTGFGIHSLVQAGARSSGGEPNVGDTAPTPASVPATSAE